MHIVVGIGNPGAEYQGTRHNCGFLVCDELARRHACAFEREKRFQAQAALWGGGDGRVLLLKPQTYVNLSGASVQAAMAFHKVAPAEVLVVVDDLNLPLGTLRLRENGSAGGHNGLKDIEARIGQAYPRLRVGIGAPQGASIPHVLGRFALEEQADVTAMLAKAADCVEAWISAGMAAANRFNGPLHPPPPRPKPTPPTPPEATP